MPEPRRRGRPVEVDPDRIARAVLDVGFDGLTFAAVADRAGIAQATLYRHAPNRDELVRLGMDLALRGYPWPSLDGPWREVLERWALASWRAWEAHPGAVVEATRGVVPPSLVQLSDEIAVALMRAGFGPAQAVLAVDLVFDLAADNRRGVEDLARTGTDGSSEAMRLRLDAQWRAADTSPETGGGPTRQERRQVRDAMVEAIRQEPVQWFLGKLRVVLAGIERELAPTESRTRGAR
ncbi:MAG TPA: helix-turn-helix domain-containing protein [Cellulomonas sp.]